jgi:hypothetical protein
MTGSSLGERSRPIGCQGAGFEGQDGTVKMSPVAQVIEPTNICRYNTEAVLCGRVLQMRSSAWAVLAAMITFRAPATYLSVFPAAIPHHATILV